MPKSAKESLSLEKAVDSIIQYKINQQTHQPFDRVICTIQQEDKKQFVLIFLTRGRIVFDLHDEQRKCNDALKVQETDTDMILTLTLTLFRNPIGGTEKAYITSEFSRQNSIPDEDN